MCGLVGAVGPINAKDEKAFKTLLDLDVLRGIHSTGVYGVNRGSGNGILAKEVGTPHQNLHDSNEFKAIMRQINICLIGHNRHATQGGINRMSAHPFEFDGLVGAHNGTLVTGWKRELDAGNYYQVDSECLYHNINSVGLKETLPKADGAYALTWWDKNTNELNIIRNSERTLFYTVSTSGVIFWASESWMLTAALGREGIKYGEVKSFEEMKHYRVKCNTGTTASIEMLEPEDLSAYEAAPTTYYGGSWKSQKKQSAGGGSATTSTNLPAVQEHELQKLIGKTISFKVVRDYANCFVCTTNKTSVVIRIFPNGSARLNEMLEVGKWYEGEVKHFSKGDGYNSPYLRLDNRTIGLPQDCDDEEEVESKECNFCSEPSVEGEDYCSDCLSYGQWQDQIVSN